MRRFLQYTIIGILVLLAILLGVNNTQIITLSMAPLPWVTDLPLYVFLLSTLIIGVVLGGTTVYLSASSSRKELRKTKKELGKQVQAAARETET